MRERADHRPERNRQHVAVGTRRASRVGRPLD